MVVSDTGAVIALAKFDRLGLLKTMYGVVHIPAFVHRELLAKLGPEASRIDNALIDVLRISPVPSVTPQVETVTHGLGRGEREAIALAHSESDALLIIDDRAGRRAAEQLGISVTGIAGIVIQAKQHGLLELVRPLLEEVQRKGYW
jgi:uncharacterized protein